MYWATALDMGNAMFKSLSVGSRFRFMRDGETMTKTRSGYTMTSLPGRTFRTGARTAVFRLD